MLRGTVSRRPDRLSIPVSELVATWGTSLLACPQRFRRAEDGSGEQVYLRR